ncbi:Pentatricopeptide repeat-containing protein [Heracleum sosnowskyi]|uniref:Pentatricopeptide repeat-containing protein n=1 Tax=Heracleum sosnowskyi TaxID=360622 RepID=A0AAD8NAY8_9APIA|nr:Pentatricopeptide repeat-containing protein [Heracleum sosnowskyi]
MMSCCVLPDEYTFSAVLPICGGIGVVCNGEQVHCLILKHGFVLDLFVGSALVDMYGKCGDMRLAMKVFDEMPERNFVSWNSMINGFLGNKMYGDAVGVFKEVVGVKCVGMNEVTFSTVLSACGNLGGLDIGRQVHGLVLKYGLVSFGYVKNSVMDMYVKCGFLEDAYKLFGTIEDRDVVTWNVIAMGCVQKGNFREACKFFWDMRCEGISPGEASFSTVLHAAASIAALEQGSVVHNQVIKTGFGCNLRIVNSLINMYAKCGCLADGHRVFDECEGKNVVTWTTMISAFQQHGCAYQAIELFKNMLDEGIKPCYITFVSVLSACSHTGRVDEGFYYFNAMSEQHNVNPGHQHYACMVDLLCRAGRLGEAKNFVQSMPIEPGASVWGALLGACNRFGNLEMGVEVAKRLFEIEPDNPGNYVLLSNIYTRNGRVKEASERETDPCIWASDIPLGALIRIKKKSFYFVKGLRSCRDDW